MEAIFDILICLLCKMIFRVADEPVLGTPPHIISELQTRLKRECDVFPLYNAVYAYACVRGSRLQMYVTFFVDRVENNAWRFWKALVLKNLKTQIFSNFILNF